MILCSVDVCRPKKHQEITGTFKTSATPKKSDEISQAKCHHQKENKDFISYLAISNNRSFRTFYSKEFFQTNV